MEKFFTKGTASGIQSAHSKRLRLILGRLSASPTPQDMDLPGLYLRQLRGKFRGQWSVRVSGNWRVTFKFEGLDAIDIDYEDYH
jgi:proteic killer suppression protein